MIENYKETANQIELITGLVLGNEEMTTTLKSITTEHKVEVAKTIIAQLSSRTWHHHVTMMRCQRQ